MSDIEATIRRCVAARELPTWGDMLDAAEEIKRLHAGLKLLVEEIIDLEGREGLTNEEWIEQVIALAQQQREALLLTGGEQGTAA